MSYIGRAPAAGDIDLASTDFIGSLPVIKGGTGSSTASAALTALGAQETLVSNTNIKTINSVSILGTGNLVIGQTTNIARSTNTILGTSDSGSLVDLSDTFTQTLTAAATLGAGWYCYLRNTGNGNITIDPNGTEFIDGITSYILKPGFVVLLTCTGTAFNIVILKERTYTNITQYTASNTLLIPAGCYVVRAYAFGAGASSTASNGGGGGGCAYGDIAVVPGQTLTLTISAGVSNIVYAGVTLLTANAASGITAGTASKHINVTNGGAFSGGAGSSSSGGGSSGSPLGTGGAGGLTQGGGGGWGGAGGTGNSNGGGGVGGPGGANQLAGPCLVVPSIDPLLFGLSGAQPAPYSAGTTLPGIPGIGGTASIINGSPGGFGAGGGPVAGSGNGGPGGFGGGGGIGTANGGPGGFGGGGGCAVSTGTPAAGGAAVIRVYY